MPSKMAIMRLELCVDSSKGKWFWKCPKCRRHPGGFIAIEFFFDLQTVWTFPSMLTPSPYYTDPFPLLYRPLSSVKPTPSSNKSDSFLLVYRHLPSTIPLRWTIPRLPSNIQTPVLFYSDSFSSAISTTSPSYAVFFHLLYRLLPPAIYTDSFPLVYWLLHLTIPTPSL